jgi:hypothetical protein
MKENRGAAGRHTGITRRELLGGQQIWKKKKTRPADVVARHGATSTSFVGRIGEGATKLWRAIEAGLTTVAFHRYLLIPSPHQRPTHGSPANASRPVALRPCCCARSLLRFCIACATGKRFFSSICSSPLATINDICDVRDSCRLESQTSTRHPQKTRVH